jgi:hypothetical protein
MDDPAFPLSDPSDELVNAKASGRRARYSHLDKARMREHYATAENAAERHDLADPSTRRQRERDWQMVDGWLA